MRRTQQGSASQGLVLQESKRANPSLGFGFFSPERGCWLLCPLDCNFKHLPRAPEPGIVALILLICWK